MVQAVNNVAYNPKTRFTKKGNAYQKTNAATWTGLGAGAALGFVKNAKIILNKKPFIEAIREIIPDIGSMSEAMFSRDEDMLAYLKSDIGKKLIESTPKIMVNTYIAAAIICTAVAGLIIGGITNIIINKVRASKADKNAQQITNNPTIITQNTNNEAKTLSKNGFSTFQNATKQ